MISDYDALLKVIDARMLETPPRQIPHLLRNLPLAVWGELLLNIPPKYSRLKARFPSMPPDIVQDNWTGEHGVALLKRSSVFVESLVSGYQKITGLTLEKARVLDFGCGWGRIIRLLYKYVGYNNIYGVDPWDESIALCMQHGVRAHLAVCDYVPRELPFEGPFDLIYAYSVFTHLSEKTVRAAFDTLRGYIGRDGVLLITIRPQEYWRMNPEAGVDAGAMMAMHEQSGFAFAPHHRIAIDGDITYGDTSISIDYIRANFPRWQIVSKHHDHVDPMQILLFLRPA
ncbi:MAG TPA: class I SAM-dependent methyltransferase [Terriglobia bacterium]|nr:class I SAM-dependent methyltransferase [Terriglobia bacterium]